MKQFKNSIQKILYSNQGVYPSGLEVDPANDRMAIVIPGDNKVKFIKISDLSLITEVNVPTRPVGIGFDSVNNRFFVMDDDQVSAEDRVYIIDGANYSVSADKTEFNNIDTARAVVFDYATDRMFMSSYTTNTVVVHKISDLSFITTMSVSKAVGLHLDVANNKLYVGCHSDKLIRIYNATTYAFIESISGTAQTIKFSEAYNLKVDDQNPNYLLANDRIEKKIVVINKTTKTIIGQFQLGQSCLYFAPVNGKIYVTFYDINLIGILEKFYL